MSSDILLPGLKIYGWLASKEDDVTRLNLTVKSLSPSLYLIPLKSAISTSLPKAFVTCCSSIANGRQMEFHVPALMVRFTKIPEVSPVMAMILSISSFSSSKIAPQTLMGISVSACATSPPCIEMTIVVAALPPSLLPQASPVMVVPGVVSALALMSIVQSNPSLAYKSSTEMPPP